MQHTLCSSTVGNTRGMSVTVHAYSAVLSSSLYHFFQWNYN